MPRSTLRCALMSAGALCLTATATPAVADAAPKVGVSAKRLNIQAGSRATVKGRVQAPATVKLQVQRGHRWVTIDRDRTDARGRYVLRKRLKQAASARVRVVSSTGAKRMRRPPERVPPRTGVVVRPRAVRQQAGLWRHVDDRFDRCRQQEPAVRDEGHAPPSRARPARARDRPRPVRRRPRVRPHRRDRAQARLQRPRADPSNPLIVRGGPIIRGRAPRGEARAAASDDSWPRRTCARVLLRTDRATRVAACA